MRFDWREIFGRARTLGQRGEALAARFLKKKGYKIVARSHRSSLGELDLVAVDLAGVRGPTVVFVEVKTRTSNAQGHPEEAVDRRKQRKLTHLAMDYRTRHQLHDYPARFDVVAITWPDTRLKPEVVHYQDAFDCAIDTSAD